MTWENLLPEKSPELKKDLSSQNKKKIYEIELKKKKKETWAQCSAASE